MLLPIYSLTSISLNTPVWNIVKLGHVDSHLYSVQNNSLIVTYPKGSYKPSASIQGGLGFYASPLYMFPSTKRTLSYQVSFADNFDWVKGGKLPGLFLGNPGASGGRYSTEGASVRIMWRANGDAEAYVYLPIGVTQPSSYNSTTHIIHNDDKGDSLWRGLFKLSKKMVNTILISIDTTKGSLNVMINGVGKSCSVNWSQLNVSGIVFDTFFGGNDSSWATPHTTYASFSNFQLN